MWHPLDLRAPPLLPMFPPKLFRIGRAFTTLRPDYERPLGALYRMAAPANLWEMNNLTVLEYLMPMNHLDHETTIETDWPSWVPQHDQYCKKDWRDHWSILAIDPATKTRLPAHARPDLGKPFKRFFNDLNSKVLKVQGVLLDRIISTSCVLASEYIDALPPVIRIEQAMDSISRDTLWVHRQAHLSQDTSSLICCGGLTCFFDMVLETWASGTVDPKRIAETLPRTLSKSKVPSPFELSSEALYTRKIHWTVTTTSTKPDNTQARNDKLTDLLFGCKLWSETRLFYTPSGYLGLATPKAREGDLVCILFGSRELHLLREEPDGEFHKIVGKAHISEFMKVR
jgi:hypothetical protein